LLIAELLAARTVLLDALQPQPLFQYLNFEQSPVKLPLQFHHLWRIVWSGADGLGDRMRQNQL
jgi:hypothetical protein